MDKAIPTDTQHLNMMFFIATRVEGKLKYSL